MNIAELRKVVDHDRIRVLTTPPPYPVEGVAPSNLPPQIEIFSLLPALNTPHMLASQRYDYRLFYRVEDYFQRFYVPSDSNMEVSKFSRCQKFNYY